MLLKADVMMLCLLLLLGILLNVLMLRFLLNLLKDRIGDQRGGEWEPFKKKILKENKAYILNSTRRTSLLTVMVTQANS
jgi:hypothetical protein